jgi:hypothetical protein
MHESLGLDATMAITLFRCLTIFTCDLTNSSNYQLASKSYSGLLKVLILGIKITIELV